MTALLSGEFPQIYNALQARGIPCHLTTADPRLPKPLQFHADLQCLPAGQGRAFVLRNTALALPPGYTLMETERAPAALYPGDCLCNGLLLGDVFYCNPAAVDKKILKFAAQNEFLIKPVKQGYTRCSVCSVTEKAIITADPSIAKAAKEEGVTVLTLCPGHIVLPGYTYGFIGGCSGKIDNILYFTGSLTSHPMGAEIKSFVEEQGVSVDELHNTPLLDIGGILPLL